MNEPTPTPAAPTAPAAAAPLVALEGVGVTFQANQVLRGISLHIPRGQTLVIIGESGCGKTVLLKLLIGLLRASVGHVFFDGQELAQLNDRDLTKQRLRFGFLFQGAALFDSLSVYDNVAFGLREQRRLPEAQIRDIVRQRLQEVGLPRMSSPASRPSFPAACASVSAWPAPWPSTPRSCSMTSPPPASTRS